MIRNPNEKDERLHIRITPELKEQLKAAADEEGMTVTTWVIWTLKKALKKQAKER